MVFYFIDRKIEKVKNYFEDNFLHMLNATN